MTHSQVRDWCGTVFALVGIVAFALVVSAVVRHAWRSPAAIIAECREACPVGWSVIGGSCSCDEVKP